MPWVKIDEGMPENPKVIGLGPAVKWAHIEAICYCARNLTDGRIPAAAARRMATATGIRQLLEAGLWERDGADYMVHDYLEYNPSREEVVRQREEGRAIRSAGGRARAAAAQRSGGGRFTSSAPAEIQQPAGSAAPAETQHRSDPDPDPIQIREPIPIRDLQNPPTPRKRGQAVDEDFICALVSEWAGTFPEQRVRDEVDKALNSKASKGWLDQRRGVRNWLKNAQRFDAERVPARRTYAAQEANRGLDHGPYAHLVHRGYE